MPSNVITLALTGDISLDAFAGAMRHLDALIDALTVELGAKGAVRWIVDELQAGSAIATIRGEPTPGHDVEPVHQVVRAYAAVGQSLERGERPAYSPRVIREAEELVAIVAGHVASIRFETADSDATVAGTPLTPGRTTPFMQADGAVEGCIQTVTSRGRLSFTLYDNLYDRAVRCYLEEGQQELARDVWGRQVIVEGIVSRDPVFGYPVTIRHITHIYPVRTVEPGAYRQARALLPREPGEDAPEERIRRMRDVG